MKNLRLSVMMLSVLFAFSCSSDEDKLNEETLLNTPVAGIVYDEAFTVSSNGGKASNITSNGVESVYIYLTSEDLGCGAPDGTEFPVTILAPRAIGTHTNNVSVTFKDPNSTDFVTGSSLTVEIISVGNTVKGRVMAGSITVGQTYINGAFEVPYCN